MIDESIHNTSQSEQIYQNISTEMTNPTEKIHLRRSIPEQSLLENEADHDDNEKESAWYDGYVADTDEEGDFVDLQPTP